MTALTCLVCSRRAQLYLCPHCTAKLNGYLTSLPWLLTELDITLRRQDRLTAGSAIGKSSHAPSPINFDALATSTDARTTVRATVRRLLLTGEEIRPPRTVPPSFIGPLLPEWQRVRFVPNTMDLCTWLLANRSRIPRSLHAGDIFRDLRDLIDGGRGDDGSLVAAINRNERRYYGPCSHITGRDRDGQARECGGDIYGPRDADMVTCPDCGVSVAAQYQLDQTEARSDLRTMDMLIDTMRNLGEVVGRNRVQAWINTGRLQPRGYYNRDRGITKKRTRGGDPAVYSLKQARELHARAHQKAGR